MNDEDVIENIHSTKFKFKDYIAILPAHTLLLSHSSNIQKWRNSLNSLRDTHLSIFFHCDISVAQYKWQ